MPESTFTVYYTSDIHGCFSSKNGQPGLSGCLGAMGTEPDALLLDGGDVLQGSPFTYCLNATGAGVGEAVAGLMGLAGYRFITLGNHDFSFGKAETERYIAAFPGTCLCANIEGLRGVKEYALFTLPNGIRVGITGVITPAVPRLERAENIAGLRFTDPVAAAKAALDRMRAQGAAITVCLCHMGLENDPVTGAPVLDADEHRACALAASLDFTLVLAGHSHFPYAGGYMGKTFIAAPPDKGAAFLRVRMDENGVSDAALVPAGAPDARTEAYLMPYEKACNAYLDAPLARLTAPIPAAPFLTAALRGSALANLINAVQLAATGADVSCASLPNTPVGLETTVTARAVTEAYPFPNTLRVLRVDRAILVRALERTAAFLCLDANGTPGIAPEALLPAPQFYNFDHFSGITAGIDLARPAGSRVVSVLYGGRELPPDKKLNLCVNDYRASGAGGYGFYRDSETVLTGTDGMQELLLEYFRAHPVLTPDTARHITFYNGKEEL